MPTTGQSPDLHNTFNEWFAVTVKVLRVKMAKLNVRNSGDLFSSIKYQVPGASEFISKGYLYYNLYGKFVDMGVGRETHRGNSGRVQTARRRKEWYSRLFYAQVMRLREITQQQYGQEAASLIVRNIEAVKDLKYSEYNNPMRTASQSRRSSLLVNNPGASFR